MKRLVHALGWPFALGALPCIAYALLVGHLHDSRAAGVVLGAASGASASAILEILAAVALRLYTVVLLPGLAIYWACSMALRGLFADRAKE